MKKCVHVWSIEQRYLASFNVVLGSAKLIVESQLVSCASIYTSINTEMEVLYHFRDRTFSWIVRRYGNNMKLEDWYICLGRPSIYQEDSISMTQHSDKISEDHSFCKRSSCSGLHKNMCLDIFFLRLLICIHNFLWGIHSLAYMPQHYLILKVGLFIA